MPLLAKSCRSESTPIGNEEGSLPPLAKWEGQKRKLMSTIWGVILILYYQIWTL